MYRSFMYATALALLCVAATSARADNSESTVMAVASNFLLPARELVKEYKKISGHELRISSGSTGKLYAQIVNGAPFAIFLAANSREPERLEKEDKIVKGSRFTYALGKLVLWSLDDKLLAQAPEKAVQAGKFDSLSLANPRTAPYGEAGQQVLTALHPGDSDFRLIRAENVTQAYQYVATGVTKVGFIAYSQLLTSSDPKQGSYWLVPQKFYTPIRQQGVLLKSAANNDIAKGFLKFLQSDKGREMISRYGYGVEQ